MTEPVVFLTLGEVAQLHDDLLERFGGAAGFLNQSAFESAVAQPQMTAFGELLHPTIWDQAAAYLFHLVQNHPFRDGNKRIGMHAALVFLDTNGYEILGTSDDWCDMTFKVAKGELAKPAISAFVRKHTKRRAKRSS